MLGADFPWILCIKTAVLKMFSLCTFKILLDLNSSLVCSNLFLLKIMRRACFCWHLFFSSVFCRCCPKRHCHSLCDYEYAGSKVIIVTFCLRMALLQIIYRYFLKSYFLCILCVLQLRFSSSNTPRNLTDSVRAIKYYLYSILVRLVGYRLIC